jgi:hypothetical protein
MLINNRRAPTRECVAGFLALASVACLIAPASAAKRPVRIRLPHGHSATVMHGYFHGYATSYHYVLHARKGQHLSLTPNRLVEVTTTSPDGKLHDGGPGPLLDKRLEQTGDYAIDVAESHMPEPWTGRFTLKVSLH